MRPSVFRALGSGLLIAMAGASPSLAQDRGTQTQLTSPPRSTAAPTPVPSRILTGKERLGEKWMDEQRIDNCKVPVDKRGTKPRPDACAKPSS